MTNPEATSSAANSYVRHGTTSLFAALDVASGFVIGKCYKRHRTAEFLNFLKEIDAQVAEGLDIHIVMDNYATHKTPKIKAWLARRPHYHVHFTPTSASWINQVERWFAELTRKRLRRGVHTSVSQLEADIRSFIERHNQNPTQAVGRTVYPILSFPLQPSSLTGTIIFQRLGVPVEQVLYDNPTALQKLRSIFLRRSLGIRVCTLCRSPFQRPSPTTTRLAS